METKKVSKDNAEYFVWGKICDGWHLARTPDISIIEERMPKKTEEIRHYHDKVWQFIFITEGELDIKIGETWFNLKLHEGLELPPKIPHNFENNSEKDTRYILISTPNIHNDRINIT